MELIAAMLFLLILSHYVCDYPLQSDFIARGKGSFAEPLYGVPWWHILTAHAATHSAGVYIVTQSLAASVFELIAHWFIDYAKCRKWTGINTDQSLHIVCKILIVAYLAWNPA